jgi:hypothetical protein
MRGRIQVSQTTADLIRSAGKGHWVQPRKDKVVAKGLGALKTFWIEQETKEQAVNFGNSSVSSETRSEGDTPPSKHTRVFTRMDAATKHGRHADWMTEVLSEYVKKIVSTVHGIEYRKYQRNRHSRIDWIESGCKTYCAWTIFETQ